MTPLLIAVWLAIGYWCTAGQFAYVAALSDYIGDDLAPTNNMEWTLKIIVGLLVGSAFTVGGPISLLLFKNKKGQTGGDKFSHAWLGEIKRSFLHPKKAEWLWPVKVFRN